MRMIRVNHVWMNEGINEKGMKDWMKNWINAWKIELMHEWKDWMKSLNEWSCVVS